MATRRNVAGNGNINSNGNSHLPQSLQAGSPTTTSAHGNTVGVDEVPSLVDIASARSGSSTLNQVKASITGGGIGTPVNFHVLAARPAATDQTDKMEMWEKQYYPGESRALSGIARRGFLLGNAASAGVALTIYLLYIGSSFWRLPAFIVTLSIFHFMEFWTTARYNTPSAQVSSYLLSSNGHAWTIAHSSAFMECLLACLYKTYGLPFSLSPMIATHIPSLPTWLLFPSWDANLNIVLGLVLVILGQIVRSLAMAQAGQSFNHVVQFRRQKSHTLVTHGIYRFSRHPSYFGFFWWGLGTQLLLGNVICFLGYAAVLWLFFKRRIEGEEKFLVDFFKEDYVEYRKKVGVLIPFI